MKTGHSGGQSERARVDGKGVIGRWTASKLGLVLTAHPTRGPASVHTCALMAKPHYRATGVPALDFVGFDAPDAFVVGYGMDGAQLYRNLPFVAALDPEAS